jgi:RimJ/RimL family protein N-acetyltransferase
MGDAMHTPAPPLYPHGLADGIVMDFILPQHADLMVRCIQQHFANLSRYDSGFADATPANIASMIDGTIINWCNGRNLSGGLWHRDRLIGRVSCKFGPTPEMINFGAWIIPPYQGRHLVPQAVSYLVQYAFRWRGAKLAWLMFHQNNQASRKAVERIGFRPSSPPHPLIAASLRADHLIYTLVRS